MKDEPVLTGATVIAIVFAAINLGQSFGLYALTCEQTSQLNTLLGLVVPLLVGVFIRRRVTPV